MESDAIRDRLMQICIKTLGRSEMEITSRQATFRQLGADSIDVLEIVTNAEDAFGVVLATKDAQAIGNFIELLGAIQRKLVRRPRNEDHGERQESGFSTESEIRRTSGN